MSSFELSSPEVPEDFSKGSSVSSGLQQEYEELLKYAVVTPRIELPRDIFQPDRQPGSAFKVKINTGRSTGTESSSEISNPSSATLTWPCSSPDSTQKDAQRDASTVHKLPESAADGGQPDGNERRTLPSYGPIIKKGEMTPGQGKVQAADSRGPDVNTPQSDSSHRTLLSDTSPVTDVDLVRVETLMDEWCLDLKRNVLAEFSNSKMKLLERYKEQLCKERERHSIELFSLQTEIENLKEVLHSYEKSVGQKDIVIQNMTTSIQKQREKYEQLQTMAGWRLQHNDIKREKFASKLASKHYDRNLTSRVMTGWRGVVESKWKQRVEKACQARAQEVCVQLTDDYEERLQALQQQLDDARAEVASLHQQRDAYEETMKKAFMRGVCALNLEAMTMFRQDGRVDPQDASSIRPATTSNDVTVGQPTSSRPFVSSAPEHLDNTAVPRSTLPAPVPQGPALSTMRFPQTKTLHVKATARGDVGLKRAAGSSFPSSVASVLVERHSGTNDATAPHGNAVDRRPADNQGKSKSVRFDKNVTMHPISATARLGTATASRPPNIKVVE